MRCGRYTTGTRNTGTRRPGSVRPRTSSTPSIHIRVRIPVRNTTKLHADTTSGSPEFRQFLAAMLRFGRVEQRENTFRGRHAVHRNVEIRAELSQRNEEIGG